MRKMRVVAIIQARMGSTRLSGKVLMPLKNIPMLEHIVRRVSRSEKLTDVVVATSTEEADDVVWEFCERRKIPCYRGSQNNVLERYYEAARLYEADVVVRLTADNPFVDAEVIDEAIIYYLGKRKLDYLSYRKGLPLGVSVEVFSYYALQRAYDMTNNPECLEHVTLFMYRNPKLFVCEKHDCIGRDYSNYRLTVDTEDDYRLAQVIYNQLYCKSREFSYHDVIRLLNENQDMLQCNCDVRQKEQQYKGEEP